MGSIADIWVDLLHPYSFKVQRQNRELVYQIPGTETRISSKFLRNHGLDVSGRYDVNDGELVKTEIAGIKAFENWPKVESGNYTSGDFDIRRRVLLGDFMKKQKLLTAPTFSHRIIQLPLVEINAGIEGLVDNFCDRMRECGLEPVSDKINTRIYLVSPDHRGD